MNKKITLIKSLALFVALFGAVNFGFGQCGTATATWAGGIWSWDDGTPVNTIPIIATTAQVNIDESYDTGTQGSFSACNLTVRNNAILIVNDGTFVEVENNVTVDGAGSEISVETQGAFVQNDDTGTFSLINAGTASLNKTTRDYSDSELHYVYWSSPVVSADLATVFPNPYLNRRYYFDALSYLDENTIGTTDGNPDDIDDDNNDWQTASGPMEVGLGYVIATDNSAGPSTYSNTHSFTGELNTGDITVPIFRNDSFTGDNNWNLIGNPYPCAISVYGFLSENYYSSSTNTGTIEGVIYLWSSNGTPSAGNPGFDTYNFSQTDYYELINLTGGTLPPPPPGLPIPIPSGQGFFVSYHNDGISTSSVGDIAEGEVYFNNNMRIADEISNSDFYKNSNIKSKTSSSDNKLWVKLTSDNGVFSQILIGYVNIATDSYDGEAFDASKNLSSGAASIHSIIQGSDKKFIIQGKAESSLNQDEIISLGFDTKIDVPTIYTLSIAQLQGDFLTNNPVYLKDNLTNTIHNLSGSDYSFTSEVGEFKDRFEIVFTNQALSNDTVDADTNALQIMQVSDAQIRFSTSNNLSIKNVRIYDLLGRQLYSLEGNNRVETYSLSNLNNSVFIAKVKLSNGAIVTKKAIKK